MESYLKSVPRSIIRNVERWEETETIEERMRVMKEVVPLQAALCLKDENPNLIAMKAYEKGVREEMISRYVSIETLENNGGEPPDLINTDTKEEFKIFWFIQDPEYPLDLEGIETRTNDEKGYIGRTPIIISSDGGNNMTSIGLPTQEAQKKLAISRIVSASAAVIGDGMREIFSERGMVDSSSVWRKIQNNPIMGNGIERMDLLIPGGIPALMIDDPNESYDEQVQKVIGLSKGDKDPVRQFWAVPPSEDEEDGRYGDLEKAPDLKLLHFEGMEEVNLKGKDGKEKLRWFLKETGIETKQVVTSNMTKYGDLAMEVIGEMTRNAMEEEWKGEGRSKEGYFYIKQTMASSGLFGTGLKRKRATREDMLMDETFRVREEPKVRYKNSDIVKREIEWLAQGDADDQYIWLDPKITSHIEVDRVINRQMGDMEEAILSGNLGMAMDVMWNLSSDLQEHRVNYANKTTIGLLKGRRSKGRTEGGEFSVGFFIKGPIHSKRSSDNIPFLVCQLVSKREFERLGEYPKWIKFVTTKSSNKYYWIAKMKHLSGMQISYIKPDRIILTASSFALERQERRSGANGRNPSEAERKEDRATARRIASDLLVRSMYPGRSLEGFLSGAKIIAVMCSMLADGMVVYTSEGMRKVWDKAEEDIWRNPYCLYVRTEMKTLVQKTNEMVVENYKNNEVLYEVGEGEDTDFKSQSEEAGIDSIFDIVEEDVPFWIDE